MKKIILLLLLTIFILPFQAAFAEKARYGEQLCHKLGYTCYTVKPGDTWLKLWPDDEERDIVRRVNRMNIYLRPGMVLAVPRNLNWLDSMDVAPMPKRITPMGEKVVIVELSQQAWGAYDTYGRLVNWGAVSGGKGWCPDINSNCYTARGEFRVVRKGNEYCRSTKFPVGKGGAPMEYCMFFHGGFALHASPTVPGYHDSHGCVRLFYEDARWLNTEFVESPNDDNDNKGTKVIVRNYKM